jgi:heterodisulfide reductase subunit A2
MVSALHLKALNPDMNLYVLYRDIRTYGEREYLYRKARLEGVIFHPLQNRAEAVGVGKRRGPEH